jgi:hypothetical protein
LQWLLNTRVRPVTRRNHSANAGLVSARRSAVLAKYLFTIAHRRLDVMPALPSRFPSNGVAGFYCA